MSSPPPTPTTAPSNPSPAPTVTPPNPSPAPTVTPPNPPSVPTISVESLPKAPTHTVPIESLPKVPTPPYTKIPHSQTPIKPALPIKAPTPPYTKIPHSQTPIKPALPIKAPTPPYTKIPHSQTPIKPALPIKASTYAPHSNNPEHNTHSGSHPSNKEKLVPDDHTIPSSFTFHPVDPFNPAMGIAPQHPSLDAAHTATPFNPELGITSQHFSQGSTHTFHQSENVAHVPIHGLDPSKGIDLGHHSQENAYAQNASFNNHLYHSSHPNESGGEIHHSITSPAQHPASNNHSQLAANDPSHAHDHNGTSHT